MTLAVLIAVLIVAAVVWRLAEIAVRLALLALAVGAVLWYAGEHHGSNRRNPAGAQRGRVVKVADGDTMTILTGGRRERVRILGIDAPESTSTREGRPDCGGQAASAQLHRLAGPGTRIRLLTDPASGDTRDRYGRLLAYVDTRDGRDLGQAQLTAGLAIIYRYRHRAFSRLSRYRRAQADARSARRGSRQTCNGRFHARGR